jgi:hypothetical protein
VSIVYDFYSQKMDRRVPYESSVEADLIIIMEVDYTIAGFWAQPETFRWRQGKRARRYTPDFLVQLADGNREYREVKLTKRLIKDPTFKGRRTDIEHECALRGAIFAVWTKSDVHKQPRYRNARTILANGGPVFNERAQKALHKTLAIHRPFSIGELLSISGLGVDDIGSVFRLIRLGEIGIDLNLPLNSSSALHYGS